MSERQRHPLAVRPLYEEGRCFLGYYSKGHHTSADFAEAAADYDGDPSEKFLNSWQGWWRFVPGGPKGAEDGYFWPANAGSRGAFPVTVWERC